jgi:V/A-type H+-transporting ATPase subunit B
MKDGIGEGSTRDDHSEVSNQVYDAYSRSQEVRALAGIVGKAGLTEIDLKYLELGDTFEKEFLTQATDENRTIEETLLCGRLYQNYQRVRLLKSKTST